MHFYRILIAVILLVTSATASAAAAEYPVVHFTGTIKYIMSDNTYEILSDDGKKYQPLKMDRQYRKDGLRVAVDGEIHKEIVGTRMWGTALRILSITNAEKYVSASDKIALQLLSVRMEAFNTKDLAKLQAIDVVSRSLTAEQLAAWINGYGNFRIRWLEANQLDNNTIQGTFLYSRDLVQGIALSGQTSFSLTQFTLSVLDGKWKFTATQTAQPDPAADFTATIDTLLAQSRVKFGTDDLNTWYTQHNAR